MTIAGLFVSSLFAILDLKSSLTKIGIYNCEKNLIDTLEDIDFFYFDAAEGGDKESQYYGTKCDLIFSFPLFNMAKRLAIITFIVTAGHLLI